MKICIYCILDIDYVLSQEIKEDSTMFKRKSTNNDLQNTVQKTKD